MECLFCYPEDSLSYSGLLLIVTLRILSVGLF
jgi:hypothetical protein